MMLPVHCTEQGSERHRREREREREREDPRLYIFYVCMRACQGQRVDKRFLVPPLRFHRHLDDPSHPPRPHSSWRRGIHKLLRQRLKLCAPRTSDALIRNNGDGIIMKIVHVYAYIAWRYISNNCPAGYDIVFCCCCLFDFRSSSPPACAAG